MASISSQSGLENSATLPDGRLGQICSPFRRLDGAVSEFTAL
jgi:hypothetical protein